MSVRGLWTSLLGFVNSELFADWLLTSLFALVIWVSGRFDKRSQYPLSIPGWLVGFFGLGNTKGGVVYLRSFVMQVMGALMLVWSLFLAIVAENHDERVGMFFVGWFVLMLLATVLVVVRESI